MTFFNTIEEAIIDLKLGKMIIVTDDEDRENEGDFVMAADKVTPEAINFMTKFGRGLICTPISKEIATKLDLPLMIQNNRSLHSTAFTVSIDSVYAGTGISAQDRSKTVEDLVNPKTRPQELLRPGHIFPLIANDGGVLKRAGHTEAAIDLANLAGFSSAGVICEILNDDGTMARRPELLAIAKKFDLKMINIKDLIQYRRKNETLVSETSNTIFPNIYGDFKLKIFECHLEGNEHHIAIIKGDVNTDEPVLVRVHSECFTGDIFNSKKCDCGDQLDTAMKLIEKEGRGVLLYMKQEGRGIGLPNKIKAYNLQDKGMDTIEANLALGFDSDLRDYGIGAQILKQLGISKVNLLTNNPAKIIGIEGHGITVCKRIPIEIGPHQHNHSYMKTKKDKMGHILHMA